MDGEKKQPKPPSYLPRAPRQQPWRGGPGLRGRFNNRLIDKAHQRKIERYADELYADQLKEIRRNNPDKLDAALVLLFVLFIFVCVIYYGISALVHAL
jgi:hypothetical protein